MAKRRRKSKETTPPPRKPPAPRGGPSAAPPPSADAPPPRSVVSCRQGPWGSVEYYHAYLEAPESLINQLSLPSNQTIWHFEEITVEVIEGILDSAQFSPEAIAATLDPRKRSQTGGVIRIFPDRDLVESLSPDSRARLYRVLSRSELNPFHHSPLLLEPADLVDAFSRIGLPVQLVRKIVDLTYREGNVTMFSDFPILLHYLTHPRQERQLLRILTRTRTAVARLSLKESPDLNALADYWAPSERQPNTKAFLESVARTPQMETLDLLHLFPPLPRSHLFTYPGLEDCLGGVAPDGAWTAVNFFSYQPLALHMSSNLLGQHLVSRFQKTGPPFQFGDMLMISPIEGPRANDLVHACTFIADNLVYTKNSHDLKTPWTISTLEEVVAYQLRGLTASVSVYRLKAFL